RHRPPAHVQHEQYDRDDERQRQPDKVQSQVGRVLVTLQIFGEHAWISNVGFRIWLAPGSPPSQGGATEAADRSGRREAEGSSQRSRRKGGRLKMLAEFRMRDADFGMRRMNFEFRVDPKC